MANRMTNAPTVMPGQATETTPTAMASRPRQSNEVEIDMTVLLWLVSGTDGDAVVDGANTRGCPSGRDRGVPLGPGAHGAAQRDRAAGGRHSQVPGVQPGVPPERLVDRAPDIAGARSPSVQVDLVPHAGDAQNVSRDEGGLVALVRPVNDADERDEAVLDG